MNNDREFFTMIDTFVNRLSRLGVDVKLAGNWPWLYLKEVNGKQVTERYAGNHGFTLAFRPIKKGQRPKFTNISEIFKLIRKYR